MARSECTRAVLLRSIAYRESDRIVTMLTESHGKVALIARGARKSVRRFAGSLEPGCIVEIEMAIVCKGPDAKCAALEQDFKLLNAKMQADINNQIQARK